MDGFNAVWDRARAPARPRPRSPTPTPGWPASRPREPACPRPVSSTGEPATRPWPRSGRRTTSAVPDLAARPAGAPCWSPAPAAPTRWRCSPRPSSRATSSALRVIGVTVDHGLQAGSAEHAAEVVDQMAGAGRRRDRVGAGARSRPAAAGPRPPPARPATPRSTSGRALRRGRGAARPHPRRPGRDRAAGAGPRLRRPRSLAGMRRRVDRYRRPLLDVTRADTVTACPVEGIDVWDDPHNADPAFTRVRVRHAGAAGPRGGARPGGRRRAGPHRRPAPRRRRALDGLAARGVRRGARRAGGVVASAALAAPARRRRDTGCCGWPRSTPGARPPELFRVHVLGAGRPAGPRPGRAGRGAAARAT